MARHILVPMVTEIVTGNPMATESVTGNPMATESVKIATELRPLHPPIGRYVLDVIRTEA